MDVSINPSPLPVNVGETSSEFYNSDDSESKYEFLSKNIKTELRSESDKSGINFDGDGDELLPELSDDDDVDEKVKHEDYDGNDSDNSGDDTSGAIDFEFKEEKSDDGDQQQHESKPTTPYVWVDNNAGGKRIYRCQSCPFETDKYNRIRYHSRMGHLRASEKLFPCSICSKTYSSPTSLQTHMKTTHEEDNGRNYECSKCGWAFRHRHHLDRHTVLVHSAPDKKPIRQPNGYECSQCQSRLPSVPALRSHMVNVHGAKTRATDTEPQECPTCHKTLKNDVSLKIHIKKAHPTKNDDDDAAAANSARHACNLCAKRFVSKSEMRYHVMRHTGKFPFKCDTCGLGFPIKAELRKHEKRSKKCATVALLSKAAAGDEEIGDQRGENMEETA